jgi:serine/threonine protein phosphatase 1
MNYACSDIHGNFEVYNKVINKLSENDTLYIIGDVIDRGADGIKILQDIMKRDNVKFILGNHEWFLWYCYRTNWNDYLVKDWFRPCNKGDITYKSFIDLSKDEQETIIRFLESSPIALKVEDNNKTYALIHGWYDERTEQIWDKSFKQVFIEIDGKRTRYGATNFEYLWGSLLKDYPDYHYKQGLTYIHGHVPVTRVSIRLEPYSIAKLERKGLDIKFIDGGLMYGGSLILYNMTTGEHELIN